MEIGFFERILSGEKCRIRIRFGWEWDYRNCAFAGTVLESRFSFKVSIDGGGFFFVCNCYGCCYNIVCVIKIVEIKGRSF